jgi:voltage-gated potassium channel Kch
MVVHSIFVWFSFSFPLWSTDRIVLGFVAFSTIGYGDMSPESPAGRSVFVVWALLGVGAMTILISGE